MNLTCASGVLNSGIHRKISKMSINLVLILLVCGVSHTQGSTVLMLAHLQGSHFSEISTISLELVNRGHTLYTVLPSNSRYISSMKMQNISVLTFQVESNDMFFESPSYNHILSESIFNESFNTLEITTKVTKKHCKMMLGNNTLMSELKDLKFDMAVVDGFLLDFCMLLVPHTLSVPMVTCFSTLPYWLMGVPAIPSFVPVMGVPDMADMSISEKLNSIMNHIIYSTNYILRSDTELLERYALGYSWEDLFGTTLLHISFRDEILELPAPRMPNTIVLPGITYQPTKPLPNHLEEIYRSSKQGVIVVSFGSSLGALPKELFKKFLNAFEKFPGYEIIWKYSIRNQATDVPKMSKNIHMFSWLPQNDCLGHIKTKLFITHCGNNGQYESLYHNVPMIGFPLLHDQHNNANRITKRGLGLTLDIHTFQSSDLVEAMNNALHNESILANVQKVSSIMKNRPHPKYEAAHWIEHVMKFGGEHLRGASIHLPWYKLLMFDILIFLLLVISISFAITVMIIRKCIAVCCQMKKYT